MKAHHYNIHFIYAKVIGAPVHYAVTVWRGKGRPSKRQAHGAAREWAGIDSWVEVKEIEDVYDNQSGKGVAL